MKGTKLKRNFYTKRTLIVAKELLGKYLVRPIRKSSISNGVKKIVIKKLIGKIVETEAYIGPQDKASHAYGGKITPRNKTEYLEGGHIYIYLCYGMYWQMNITTARAGEPECVLIRALEPVSPERVASRPYGANNKQRTMNKNLANGPGKLCRWMKLDKSFDTEDLTKSKRIWLENGETIKKSQIVSGKRVGIDYAGIWTQKPWRFYLKDNQFVSKY